MPHRDRRHDDNRSNVQAVGDYLKVFLLFQIVAIVVIVTVIAAFIAMMHFNITPGEVWVTLIVTVVLAWWQKPRLRRGWTASRLALKWGVYPETDMTDAQSMLISGVNAAIHKIRRNSSSAARPDNWDYALVASDAMRRAGWQQYKRDLWLSDIGLLVYGVMDRPSPRRHADISTSAEHIRPFMVIEANKRARADALAEAGKIRFDLLDERNNLRFTAYKNYPLQPGQNFITPDTWLTLSSQPNQPSGEWKLQVLAGQSMIADHPFGWRHGIHEVAVPLTADGEITKRARAALKKLPDEQVSLADLLAEQDDNDPQQQPEHVGAAGGR